MSIPNVESQLKRQKPILDLISLDFDFAFFFLVHEFITFLQDFLFSSWKSTFVANYSPVDTKL